MKRQGLICRALAARPLRLCLGTLCGLGLAFIPGCGGARSESGGFRLPERLEIEVTGEDRRWTARYPGVDGQFQTADDVVSPGEVCVPVGVPVVLHLRSNDYVYIFSLPHAGLKEIAVPDLEYQLELVAEKVGEYQLLGGIMCGRPNTNHGTFAALTKDEFLDWHAASTN